MSTIKVVNIQHPDSVDPNLVLQTDGDTVFASGLTVSGTFDIVNDLTVSGNTGLGTSSPTSKLHVVDTTTNLQLESTANSSSGKIDFVGKDASSNSYRTLTIDTNSTGEVNIETDPDNGGYSTDKSIIFKQAGSEKARIDNSGNIGIGTNNPASTLDVYKSSDGEYFRAGSSNTNRQLVFSSSNTSFDGDTHTINASSSAGHLILATADTNRIFINSSGNIGIGTNNPTEKLTVDGNIEFESNTQSIKFAAGNSAINSIEVNSGSGPRASIDFLGVGTSQTTDIVFKTPETSSTSAERMRIKTTTGYIGIGTNSPTADLEVKGDILTGTNSTAGKISAPNHLGTDISAFVQVNAQGDKNPSISLNHARSNNFGASCFIFNKAYGDFTTPIAVGSSADIGSLVFNGFDGTNYIRAAQITAETDGTPGTNDMPGRLTFFTTADGASAPTEQMRIDSSGNIGIGTDSPETKLDVLLSSTGNTIRVQTGRNDLPYTTYRSDTGSYLHVGYNKTLDALAFSSGANPEGSDPLMVITPVGKVGIGTTNPLGILEIAGNNTAQTIKYGDGTTTGYFVSKTDVDRSAANAIIHSHQYLWVGNVVARIKALTGDDTVNKDNGYLTFETSAGGGATERLRIDSDGNVGIGTNNPDVKLHVYSSDITQTWSDNAADLIKLEGSVEGINFVTSSTGFLAFSDANARARGVIEYLHVSDSMQFDTAGSERMRITNNGRVGIGTDTPDVALDVNGEVRASTGVLFGTDTAAANTLDDYEEGTWTPGIRGGTTAGTYTFTSTGAYTKVGNKVTVWGELTNIVTVSAGSGIIRVTGLPFVSALGFDAIDSILLDQWNLSSTAYIHVVAQLVNNVNYMQPRIVRDGATDIGLQITDKTNDSADIRFCITYTVA